MDTTSLNSLPDELLLDIVDRLDTARDVASLAATSRHAHSLMKRDGWRAFVKQSFSNLNVPPDHGFAGDELAERLTYLDRCWEKRGFVVYDFREDNQRQRTRKAPRLPRQSVSFYPVLEAGLVSSSQQELAVWGVGEDLMTRLTPTSGKGPDTWNQIKGRAHGYTAGFGDVTALSIVNRQSAPELLVGRANGDIQLSLAAGDDAGTTVQNLKWPDDTGDSLSRKSPGKSAITWLEWHPSRNLAAGCKHTGIALYDLNDQAQEELAPVAYHDLSSPDESSGNESPLARSVKFLGKDKLVCALGGSKHPLRWATLTPTGLVFSNANVTPRQLEYMHSKAEVAKDRKTTLRAIETVGTGVSESLILSAWDDGTYRLTDVRSPSPYDAVYRDRWQMWEPGSSLLVYGTQRFIAGSNTSSSLHLFDFRYPKPYQHTTAMPCSISSPQPEPPFKRHSDSEIEDCPEACDPPSGRQCAFHKRSQLDNWRPDATLVPGPDRDDRVYSLAKASDISDSFYCGLHGAVLQISMRLNREASKSDQSEDQNMPSPPWRWRVRETRDGVALSETGVGLGRENEWDKEVQGFPLMLKQDRSLRQLVLHPGHLKYTPQQQRPKYHPLDLSRLDLALYKPNTGTGQIDFGEPGPFFGEHTFRPGVLLDRIDSRAAEE